VLLFKSAKRKRFDYVWRFLETKGASREELLQPVAMREDRRNTVLGTMFGGRPCRERPWADDWVKAAGLVLDIVAPDDLLVPVNWVAHAAQLREERIVELMLEKCIHAPEFTVDAKLAVLENVVSNEWPTVAAMLVETLDPALLVEERFLRWPIQCGSGNTDTFKVIADVVTDEQLLACPGKQSLLGTACNSSRWTVARMLLDRTPEALLTASRIGPVINVFCQPPPLDVWQRIVDGTPEELLLYQGYRKRTILHKVARDFSVDHYSVLAVRIPPSVRAMIDTKGRSPLDVAVKRARGEVEPHYGEDKEQFIADGEAIASLLRVGSVTKAACVS